MTEAFDTYSRRTPPDVFIGNAHATNMHIAACCLGTHCRLPTGARAFPVPLRVDPNKIPAHVAVALLESLYTSDGFLDKWCHMATAGLSFLLASRDISPEIAANIAAATTVPAEKAAWAANPNFIGDAEPWRGHCSYIFGRLLIHQTTVVSPGRPAAFSKKTEAL